MATGTYNVVDDYSADKTGVADSTTAINNALNAATVAGGGVVVIPAGQYKVLGNLTITGDNTHIRAYGASLHLANGLNCAGNAPYNGPSHVSIAGGVWDFSISVVSTDGLYFAYCQDVVVEDLVIQNVPDWHGIEFNSSRRCTARGVWLRGHRIISVNGTTSKEAIQIDRGADHTHCSDITIDGCRMSQLDGVNPGWGKLTGNHVGDEGYYYENIRVTNNHVEDAQDYAIGAMQWRNSIISGNTIKNCNGGVFLDIPSDFARIGPYDSAAQNVSITNNTFMNIGVLNGADARVPCVIDIVGSGNGVTPCRSVHIQGNTVHGWYNQFGIRARWITDLVVANNILTRQLTPYGDVVAVGGVFKGSVMGNVLTYFTGKAVNIYSSTSVDNAWNRV